ncbi:MAG: hypothetical protein JWM98_664, partial [Thermoleophilia bacterium]|nr:hypothetical protein [Thermoleophilia bacterium]
GGAAIVLPQASTGESLHQVVATADGGALLVDGTGSDSVVTRYAASTIGDYAEPATWSGAASTGLFGACLRAKSASAVGAWTVDSDATCTASDTDPWQAVPEAANGASVIARTSGAGVTDAWAALRFGARVPTGAPGGAMSAPLVVEVVSPELSPPVNVAPPAITGTATRGQVLQASTGTWNGGQPMTYAFQWLRCDAAGANCGRVAGATTARYTTTAGDVARTMRVEVTARNASGSLAARSTQTGATAVAKPTLTYLTGFEHNRISAVGGGIFSTVANAGGGTTTMISGGGVNVRTGSNSLHQQTTAAGEALVAIPVVSTASVVRIAYKMPTAPTGGTPAILQFSGNAGAALAQLVITPAGQLRARFVDTGSVVQASVNGPNLNPGAWTTLEASLDVTGTTWALRWRVDGVEQPATSYAIGAGYTISNIDIGVVGCNCVGDVYTDDLAMSTTLSDYPIGDGKVLGFSANAVGTHSGPGSFRTVSAAAPACGTGTLLAAGDTTSFAQLADWSVAAENTAVCASAAPGANYLEYDMPPTSETANPNAVRFLVGADEAAAATTTLRTDVRFGGTGSALNVDPGTAPGYYASTLNLRPDGGTWLASNLDNVRYRISVPTFGSATRVEGVLAEVDFPLTATAPVNTVPPSVGISSAPQEGDRLDGDPGTWANASDAAYTYTWTRCNPACGPIAGATDPTYTLVAADVGGTVQLSVTATSIGGSNTAYAPVSATIVARTDTRPDLIDAPRLSGGTVVGRVVSGTLGTWDNAPTSWARQWLRCDADGTGCVPIAAATSATYTLVATDVGSRLRERVTATNGLGSRVASSEPSPIVKAVAPTLVSVTGFEAGLVSSTGTGLTDGPGGGVQATAGNSEVRASAGAARSGGYGLAVAATGNANPGSMAYVIMPGTPSGAVRVARFYVRVDDLPDLGTVDLAGFDDGAVAAWIDITSAGVLQAQSASGTAVNGPSITAGTWYRIDVRHDTSASIHTLEWSVDGAVQPTAWHSAGAAAVGDWMRLGLQPQGSATSTAAASFDDYAFSSTSADYPIGPGEVRGLRPDDLVTATSNAGSFTDSLAVAPFAPLRVLFLADAAWSDTSTDWVRQNTFGANVLNFSLENPAEAWEADGVRGVLQYHSAASPVTGITSVTTSAGNQTVYSGTMASGATLTTAGAMVPKPAGGWTTAELDALRMQVGNANQSNRAIWDALLTEFDVPR